MPEEYYPSETLDSLWEENLRNGMWPQSILVWYVAFWLALLLIRPWELLMPSLGTYHVERCYAILGIIMVLGSGKLRFCPSFQTTSVILYLSALTLSAVCAFDFSLAWDALYVYITLVIFYFVLLSSIRTPYELLFIVTCFVVAMAAYLSKAEFEYFVYDNHGWSQEVAHLEGIENTYGHYNAVAASTVLSFPFTLFLWQVRKPFTQQWPKFWQRMFVAGLISYFAIAFAAIALTNSRSGMLAAAFFVVLSALTASSFKFERIMAMIPLALIMLAVLWVVMPEASKGRLRTVWNPEAGPKNAYISAQGRVLGFEAGMEMFKRYPLTGVGIGNFIPYRVENLDGIPLIAHNTVGGVFGETGLVGGIAFALMCFGVFANCHAVKRTAKMCPHPLVQVLGKLAVACRNTVILFLFSGLFGDNQQRFHLLWALAFCLMAKMMADKYSRAEEVVYTDDTEWNQTAFA
jgi:O-antigen ligase